MSTLGFHILIKKSTQEGYFVITTDGLENASTEFTYDKIRQMISKQEEIYNWQFIFMGANLDVAKESHKLGIHPSMSFSFQKHFSY